MTSNLSGGAPFSAACGREDGSFHLYSGIHHVNTNCLVQKVVSFVCQKL